MEKVTFEDHEKTWEEWLKLITDSKGKAQYKREDDKLVFSYNDQSVTITKEFLNHKLNDPDGRRMSPFLYIISMSQAFAERNNFKLSIDFFRELISLGADVNYQNIPGETPLYLAVWAPNIELATLLLEKGAKINAITAGNDQTLEGEETPLMMAVRQDNIEMTQLLLSHNADPTMKNSNGKTVVTMVKSDAMLNILIPLQPYNDLLNQFPKIIQQYMKWTAFPKISEQKIAQNIVKAKDSIKGLNFDKLTQNPEIKRTLFNLIFYMNTLPAKNKKKEELQKFITELSNVSLEDASKMCSTALKDNDILVKNRAIFGGYKFFHSLPNKIINKNRNGRLARSTTEELLIDFNKALEEAGNISDYSEDVNTTNQSR